MLVESWYFEIRENGAQLWKDLYSILRSLHFFGGNEVSLKDFKLKSDKVGLLLWEVNSSCSVEDEETGDQETN